MFNTDMPRRAELPSAARLLKSTGLAAIAAVAILFTVVVFSNQPREPAFYGNEAINRLLF